MQTVTVPVPREVVPSSTCTVCGECALQKYVGVLVCSPCKMFFRRYASTNQTQLQCNFDGHCQIDVHNRHACRSCRLKKCFSSGMQSDLLRGSRSKAGKSQPKTGMPGNSHISRTTEARQLQQFPTLNLLRADQSILSVEQWNLLSNLIHCYDEHSGFSMADRFVREQNILPVKARFKVTAVNELIAPLLAGSRLLFEKNKDFLSLSSHDRFLLVNGRLEYIACLGACFILTMMGLYQNSAFYSTAEVIYGTEVTAASKRTSEQFDSNIIFFKVILAIILFSTLDYTVYRNTPAVSLENVHAILQIQDTYIELAWRYLIYKYDYSYAVKCFSKIIRCIFNMNHSLVAAATCIEYKTTVHEIIKQTEEIFIQ